MLLRKTPVSKRLTSDEIESRLRDVVSIEMAMIISSVRLKTVV